LEHEDTFRGIILLVIVAILAFLTKGSTLRRENLVNIWLHSSVRGIVSVGQAFVILTGGIDLTVGGLALMTANLGAYLMTGQAAVPVWVVPTVLLVAVGIGAVNGSLVSRVGVPALIVTLAMWRINQGISYGINHGLSIANLPKGINFIGSGYIAGVPVPVVIFISIILVAHFVLNHTNFGRHIYAVGGNRVSAWLAGINVKNTEFSVYVISGFLAGVAGLVTMARVMSASMVTTTGLELDSIAAVVIGGVSLMGGKGSIIGVVIGTMILGVISNGMNIFAINPAYQDMVKGGIILGAVTADYMRRRR
jgi:ribose/xylose/arabinose/galactoside ABC-type transport system permease subunit